ncbi:oxygen-independent coproporphyrinogen III oxidase [Roseibium sp.]|uniref:oxygen-independent coproporphyrinogen III oxidase n=1 Tax=Roseibium sp. TaxID=1936156 RepID=UPI003A96DDF8
MTDTALTYAMRTVPRYTSYPTAPHFHSGITDEVYAGWLEKLGPTDTLSLYLHVPYCREICHYCGCHTKATRQEAPLAAYAQTLGQELELIAGHLNSPGPVKHIHWGGGTPSLLPEDSLRDLSGLMRVLFDFAPDMEHAIELDPRVVGASLAHTLVEIGVNRASLGVQDFDPEVQKAIGRIQPYKIVEQATGYLRAAGLENLNFDLMYGLPAQTTDTIRDTVARTVDLKPGRVALFGYAHVPWMKKHQKLIDETILPSPAERLELAEVARRDLIDAGYVAIGLDHFAREDDSMAIAVRNGDLRRNFQGYTTDQGEQLIGAGVSSIGRLTQGYVQNIPDVGNWRRSILAGKLPVARGLALSKDDLLRGRIIEQLMTDYRCDLQAVCRSYGVSVATLKDSIAALDELVSDGLVSLEDDNVVRITHAGQPYVRLAAAAFDAYLADSHEKTGARHSMAV